MEDGGYRKISALELPPEKQAQLRNILRHELTEALLQSIRENPPNIDLAEVQLVLRPEQQFADWSVVADCGTCGTCSTCGTCGTCGTT